MSVVPYKRRAAKKEDVPTSVKKYVKTVLNRNIEIKERAYVDNFTQTNNTGLSLVYPSQGTANSERIGDEIRLHSMRLRGLVSHLSTITPHNFRCIVYMSRSLTGLPFTDLFYGTPSTQIPSILNPNYLRILYDETMSFDLGAESQGMIDVTIPLQNKVITFDLNSTVPKQDSIHIWFFQCDNLATPVNGQCRITYDVLLRYRDA